MKATVCDHCGRVIQDTGYGAYRFTYAIRLSEGRTRERKKVDLCYSCNYALVDIALAKNKKEKKV